MSTNQSIWLKMNWSKRNDLRSRSVALGTFDGVHLGHQELLKRAVAQKERTENLSSMVLTFNIPPEQYFNKKIQLVTSLTERVRLLHSFGIDEVAWVDFSDEFAKMEPEVFIEELLIKTLCAKHVVCGYNYRFGYRARGNPELLAEYGKRYGFSVEVVPPLLIENEPVSSTRIRQLLANGLIPEATMLLGRYPFYCGKVVEGSQRGRRLGFPTANLEISPDFVIPLDGVYLTYCRVHKNYYPAVTSISDNPTFNGEKHTIESYLLGFNGSLYYQELEVHFLRRIRDIFKFDTIEELIEQIADDVKVAEREIGSYHLQCTNGMLE